MHLPIKDVCMEISKPLGKHGGQKNKKPNQIGWAFCLILWLPDLGSNQGPTD